MVDKLELAQNEIAYIDTTSNTATILCFTGNVEIRNAQNTIIATLNQEEIFTLPIQTGMYSVKGLSATTNKIYIFRLFVY